MSSFILDATVIRASRLLDMGSKGIWEVLYKCCAILKLIKVSCKNIRIYCEMLYLGSTSSKELVSASKVWGHMIFSSGGGTVHNQSVFGMVGTNII